jgi:hypothetical protein
MSPIGPSPGLRGGTGSGGGGGANPGPPLTGGVNGGGGTSNGTVPCPGGKRIPREAYNWNTASRMQNFKCRWDMGSSDYVCCPGNFWTGTEGPIPTPDQIRNPNYNNSPCANPAPPPECRQALLPPRPGTVPRPPPNPIGDSIQYVRGLAQGFGDCGKMGQDLLAAAAAFAKGDYVTTADILGLKPGESIVLRGIAQEATANALGASPFEAGRLAGRRICMYAIVPGGLKAARSLRGIQTAGATPYRPLKGNIIADAASADAAAPAGEAVLPGKWIQTPKGPVQLGPLRGAGKFGNVYEIAGQKGRVIKVGNANPNSAASFPRQVDGANALQQAGVPTPAIEPGPLTAAGGPPMLFMQDILNRWPGAQILKDIVQPGPAQLNAIRNLYSQIGNSGNIWVDGNPSNTFLYSGPGGITAGVVDADMVFQDTALRAQPPIVQNNLVSLLQSGGKGGLLFENSVSASRMMDALFQIRFGQ